MNKFLLIAFLALLACQSSDGQLIITAVIQFVASAFSFCGGIISATWNNAEISAVTVVNSIIQVSTSAITSTVMLNTKLGLTLSTSSTQMTSINVTVAAMQAESAASSSQMTQVNAMMSESTIITFQQKQTAVTYLLLRAETSCVAQTVSGSPDTVPGFDPTYPNPTILTTVGQQAQAFIAFSTTISTEILDYCQQFIDIAKTVENNCTTCPTLEQCQEVTKKWENASMAVSAYSDSTTTGTTLIKTVNATVQAAIIDAISSTNTLINNLKECAKCLNTGCTKNKAVIYRPCDRRKSNGSMTKSKRKTYCKAKADSSARRQSRNVSRCRKNKKRRSVQRQRAVQTKTRGHWRNVWTRARSMASSFNSNSSSTSISNVGIRTLMIGYGLIFGRYTDLTGNATEAIAQNATDNTNAAQNETNELIKTATKTFNTEVYNFSMQVLDENVESCLNFTQQAKQLQFAFLADVSKCSDYVTNVTQQTVLNCSQIYTGWIVKINYWSKCHDKCVGAYCPMLTIGDTTAVGLCFTLKRLFPFIYDNSFVINGYKTCHSTCMSELQIAITNITSDAQMIMESNTQKVEEGKALAKECIASTLTAYEQKLDAVKKAYADCAASSTTTTLSTSTITSTTTDSTTTSTDSTSSSTTDSTTSSSTTDSTTSTSTTDSTTSTSTAAPTTTSTVTTTTKAPLKCPGCMTLQMIAMVTGSGFLSNYDTTGCFCDAPATPQTSTAFASLLCCN